MCVESINRWRRNLDHKETLYIIVTNLSKASEFGKYKLFFLRDMPLVLIFFCKCDLPELKRFHE